MKIEYPTTRTTAPTFDVAEGSEQHHDLESRLLWVHEPSGKVRAFNKFGEIKVPDNIAAYYLSEVFGVGGTDDDDDLGVQVRQPRPDAVPTYRRLPKNARTRKHHSRVVFYGCHEASVPSGSQYRVTDRGVAVRTPFGTARLYTARGRVPLTPADEKDLASGFVRKFGLT